MRPTSIVTPLAFVLTVLICTAVVYPCSALGERDNAPPSSPARPAPRFRVQLDRPPIERWTEVGHAYGPQCLEAAHIIQHFLGLSDREVGAADLAGEVFLRLFPAEYADELRGVSQSSGVPLGILVMANLYYELSAGCTSIVAQQLDGTMFHGRNLDFGAGDQFTEVLRNITIDVDFYQGDSLAYRGTTFACYIGMLTGMRPGQFAVSVDEHTDRDQHGNLLEVIEHRDAAVVGLLIRDTLANSTYEQAITTFSTHRLIAPVYLIVSGVSAGQGAVITRERNYATNVWRLGDELMANRTTGDGVWFQVETNYDHWNAPPSSDDRRDPAIRGMESMGQSGLTLAGMFDVLSTPPVFNALTTYTTLMVAKNDTFAAFVR